MKYSMRTQLTLSFAATALICVLLIGLFSNVQLSRHFKEYLLQNQLKENKEIIELISSKVVRDESWNLQAIEDISILALKRGMILKVNDGNGEIIWESSMILNENSKNDTNEIKKLFEVQKVDKKGNISREVYSVTKGDRILGTVEITFYDSIHYNDIDIHFVKTLNAVFISVGIVSLIMSIIFGIFLSERISRPIIRVIKKAKLIVDGNYEELSIEKSSTREISDLATTINELAINLDLQEKLRKRLTGDVAHELRTPLTTIQSHIEAMIDGVWEPTKERLNSCDEEITRIIRLVSDLEKLAHYESENLVLKKSYFRAKEFLEQLIQSFEVEFSRLSINVIIECDETEFFADRDKLSQVFINLMSNSLKFTPQDGTFKVIIRENQGYIDITVSDTGQGIPAQDLPHIFERFYRADVSRNRMTGGSGIGLSLVKAIVEAHEGSISVSSEINKGTSFIIHLPK